MKITIINGVSDRFNDLDLARKVLWKLDINLINKMSENHCYKHPFCSDSFFVHVTKTRSGNITISAFHFEFRLSEILEDLYE